MDMTAANGSVRRGQACGTPPDVAGVCDEIVARMKHDPILAGRARRVAVACEVVQRSFRCRRPPLAAACSILRARTPCELGCPRLEPLSDRLACFGRRPTGARHVTWKSTNRRSPVTAQQPRTRASGVQPFSPITSTSWRAMSGAMSRHHRRPSLRWCRQAHSAYRQRPC